MLVEERMQFFKRYEMAIFFREAWKNEACKQEILEAYEKIVARYGEIL